MLKNISWYPSKKWMFVMITTSLVSNTNADAIIRFAAIAAFLKHLHIY